MSFFQKKPLPFTHSYDIMQVAHPKCSLGSPAQHNPAGIRGLNVENPVDVTRSIGVSYVYPLLLRIAFASFSPPPEANIWLLCGKVCVGIPPREHGSAAGKRNSVACVQN